MSQVLKLSFSDLSRGACFTTKGYFSFVLRKLDGFTAEIVQGHDQSGPIVFMDTDDVVHPVFVPVASSDVEDALS